MARLDMGLAEMAHLAEKKPTADDLFELGIIYATGDRVSTDMVAAHKWFNLAARSGNDEAAYHRHSIADEMSPDEIANAQRSAREWLTTH